MIVSPYVFKSRAMRALRGNWQTALLVSFFASLPTTLLQLVQATRMPDLTRLGSFEAMQAALLAVPRLDWWLLGAAGGLTLVLTPMLSVGCNYYFLRRMQGEELGFRGLFSRAGVSGKALLLFLLMYVKITLWSLLLVVPGIIAALRYSMAPFYLAQDPSLGVLEALRKSKECMRRQKTTFLMLQVSFLAWLLGAMLCETLLSGFSVILALVASQFVQLVMAAYLNAACAGFYLAVSVPGGLEKAQAEAVRWLRSVGMGGFPGAGRPTFGNDDNTEETPDATDEPDSANPDGGDGGGSDGTGDDGAEPLGGAPRRDGTSGDGEEP
ncbi:MAG: DUF975 family protein [Clostridiales bacterium]|nr:DUF975 family protein [Clostridiales bacterium]